MTLIQIIRIKSQHAGMEFSLETCSKQIMRSGKSKITDRIELPNQERNNMLKEKETYEYLGILEAYTIKQTELKEKRKRKRKRVAYTNEKTSRTLSLP